MPTHDRDETPDVVTVLMDVREKLLRGKRCQGVNGWNVFLVEETFDDCVRLLNDAIARVK